MSYLLVGNKFQSCQYANLNLLLSQVYLDLMIDLYMPVKIQRTSNITTIITIGTTTITSITFNFVWYDNDMD